jgi:integrase
MISQPLTFSRFFADSYALEKTLCRESVRQKTMVFDAFDRWHGSPVAVSDLCDPLANRFILHQLERLAPKTVHRQRGDILAVWRHAADEHGLCAPPKRVRRVKVPRRIPDAWTREEWGRIIAAARNAEGVYPCGIKIADWWELFALAGYDTALRLDDLLSLPRDVATMDSFTIIQSKTQESVVKRLSGRTKEVARRTLHVEREMLLPWQFCRWTLGDHWRRFVLIPAGLPTGRREGPQKIRRTSASHLERVHPGAAQRHLGHLTPGLAQRHYIDPRIASAEPPLPPELG